MPVPTLWVSVGLVLVVIKELLITLTMAHASITQSINRVQTSKHVPTGRSLKPDKLVNSCSCCFTHYLFTVVGISLFDSPRRYHARNQVIL
jgi:hypothetical protein